MRGRNIYPQDIEWTVERCHRALRAGGTSAFAVEIDGIERLAIVQESERARDQAALGEIMTSIRRAVAEQHDIDVHAIRLIKMLSSAENVERQGTAPRLPRGLPGRFARSSSPNGHGRMHRHPRSSRDQMASLNDSQSETVRARPPAMRSLTGWRRRSPARLESGPKRSIPNGRS